MVSTASTIVDNDSHSHLTSAGMRDHTHRLVRRTAVLIATALTVAACGTSEPTAAPASDDDTPQENQSREVSRHVPRVLVAHEGGLTLLDTETGEAVASEEVDGFLRLSDTGDGRHVAVADGSSFRFFDTGLVTEEHGDHDHLRVSAAGLTATRVPAEGSGHVVPHAGTTTFFADGTGEILTLPTDQVASPDAPRTTARTRAPHHGVALRLGDGTLLTTQGTASERRTVELLDGDRVLARTRACPGVHGEATAAPSDGGDVVVLGCEDGPVVLRGGKFHKVDAGLPYARTGILAGHPQSHVVLSDFKTNPDADLERPTRVALVDTATITLRTVDLGSSYWFRSLARGPEGEALVLTYDGTLRVLDEETGEEVQRIEVIEPWQEKDDWQLPGPVLRTAGDRAYVTDAEEQELVVVDLTTGTVERRIDLPAAAVEMAVVTGAGSDDSHGHDHDHEDAHGHEHGHEH